MAVTAGDDGEGAAANPAPGRLSTGLARARALANLAYRDPDHVVERLTLEFTARAAEPARAWAQAQGTFTCGWSRWHPASPTTAINSKPNAVLI